MVEEGAPLGRIVTFYSYKGGTGRSMALANVAWILANQGLKVLAIDWDLEAPGLHRYFQPFLRDPSLASCEGVMDFVIEFSAAAVSPSASHTDESSWFRPFADLRRYAFSLEWEGFPRGGTLDFVPAGRQDAGYAVRVNSFNWQHFYDKLGGGIFLEEMKRQLRGQYDYVLVDSRTGVSDTSGVCTVQLPDDLIVCFTLNQQSIDGACNAALSALYQRRRPDGSPGLRVLPLPTRVDLSEKERLHLARLETRKRFGAFLDDWLDDDQRDEYWGSVEVPYVPFYALEEVLATFGDSPSQTKSVLASMEAVVGWLTEKHLGQLRRVDEKQRTQVLKRFLRKAETAPASGAGDGLIYVSFARQDDSDELQRFTADLIEEVALRTGQDLDRVVVLEPFEALSGGDHWSHTLRAAVDGCRTMIAILTPAYVNSAFAYEECMRFTAASKPVMGIQWVPTRPSGERPAAMQPFPLEGYAAKEGMRALLRLERYKDEYRSALMDVAKEVVDQIWRSAMRLQRTITVAPPVTFKKEAPDTTIAPEIQFVVLAERADAIRAVRSNDRPYGTRRRDWRPFWSMQGKTAGEIGRELAKELGVGVKIVSLHAFEEWVRRKRKPPGHELLMLVDPWTALMPDHRKLLRDITQRGDLPCAIVACYDSDGETKRQTERLREALDAPMIEGSSTQASPFPNASARLFVAQSPDELQHCLHAAHGYLKAALRTPG